MSAQPRVQALNLQRSDEEELYAKVSLAVAPDNFADGVDRLTVFWEFKIDEDGLTERLEALDRFTNGQLVYADTAGVRQVYRRAGPLGTMELLANAYDSGNPVTAVA